MTPLQKIAEWFLQQPPEVQAEIARRISVTLFAEYDGVLRFDDESKLNHLREWLTATGLHPMQVIGRVWSFRIHFDHAIANRFKAAMWKEYRIELWKKQEAAKSDPDEEKRIKRLMTGLRQRRKVWMDVGMSWKKLGESISDSALFQWYLSEVPPVTRPQAEWPYADI